MKQEYIKPMVHVRRITFSAILAGSNLGTSSSPANKSAGQMSKESSGDWDDVLETE